MSAGPVSVTVTVINEVTRDPIPGATVDLNIIDGNINEGSDDNQSDKTDGNGKKIFRLTYYYKYYSLIHSKSCKVSGFYFSVSKNMQKSASIATTI